MGKKRRISVKQFKDLATDPGSDLREQLPNLVVCRSEPFELELREIDGQLTPAISDESKLERVFTISTPAVDRDGDVLDERWELDNFNKGGSVLFGHVSNRPEYIVAAPRATWVESKRLRSRAEFTPREVNPLGHMVFRLIDFGALRGASVGFRPIEFEEAEDRDGFMPMNFGLKELLEYSMTPVPSNPEALDEARSAGIDLDPFVTWAEEVLDSDTDLVVVSNDLVEASWKVVRGKTRKSTVTVPGALEKDETSLEVDDLSDRDKCWGAPASSVDDADEEVAELDIQEEIRAANERIAKVIGAIGLQAEKLARDVATLVKAVGDRGLSDEHVEQLQGAKEQLEEMIKGLSVSQLDVEEPSDFDKAFDAWLQSDRENEVQRSCADVSGDQLVTADQLKDIANEVLGSALMQLTGRVPDLPPTAG